LNINDLNKSISSMNEQEAQNLIYAIRKSRRINKKPKKTTKRKVVKKELSVKDLNKDQKKALLAILMEG